MRLDKVGLILHREFYYCPNTLCSVLSWYSGP